MPSIHRMESPDGDTSIGGLMVVWDDLGTAARGAVRKVCSWQAGKPVDVPQTARRIVESLIEEARKENREDVLRDTNWVSLTACVCSEVAAWNARFGIVLS